MNTTTPSWQTSSPGQNVNGSQHHHSIAIRGLERQTTHSTAVHTHKNGSAIGALSVYPMELLAMVAALQLAAHIQSPITKEIVTDSLGRCQIANRRKKYLQLTNNYVALMNPLQHYLKLFKGTIRGTPAHPEKRSSMAANWARDERLSHVTDKVAMGKVDFDIDCQNQLIELRVEDVMKDLIQPNSGNLQTKDGTTPILAGLQQQIEY